MKKIFLSMFALFGYAVVATAQTVTVADVEALPGETVTATLNLEAPADTYTGFQLSLQFPATGFSVDAVSGWTGLMEKGAMTDGKIKITASGSNAFTESAIAVKFTVDASVALNNYDVTVSGQFEGPDDGFGNDIKTPISDVTFKVKVVNVHSVVLDETSTVAPLAATGVNVTVKRTINANEWSTICLPFAMDATQVKAAFGNDVKLGDFTGYTPTYDGSDNVTAITVNFNDATAIEANHPYIIKVSSAITEFTADAVTIDPQEAIVSFGETTGTGKNKKYHPSDFIGTYVADFDFYSAANSYPLFLNANKFWYATSSTKHMKAFRAFFDLDDYLPEAEGSSAPIFISFDNNATGINNIQQTTGDDRYYNLNGQHVENPRKGQIYIKNNKKVVVK